MLPELKNNGSQNLKRLLPKPKTIATRTENDCYQNRKQRLPDPSIIADWQSTEAESKLSAIYDLLYINPKPLGKRKSMLHPNSTSKNTDIENQRVT